MEHAIERARLLAREPWQPVPPDGRKRTRRVAIGDPQASFTHLARILEEHGLLGDDGLLARSVALVSMGDHFDYTGPSVREVGDEGVKILRWLAAHPEDQVTILAGNHDLSRVMELGLHTDATFQRARLLAREVELLRKQKPRTNDEDRELEQARARFHETFPDLATAELVDRDYATFTEEQRALVQALLVARRFRLAHVERTREGAPALLTHAGVTRRELALLGIEEETDPLRVAARLEAFFGEAIGRVKDRWARSELAELDLGQVQVAGHGGKEGGGLLYHRPVHPPRPHDDALAPRTYDPRELPRMVQACGHTGHKKSLKDLKGALTPSAQGFLRGGVRTLTVSADRIVYEAGIVPGGERVLHMIDAEINYVAFDAYPILELGA